MKPRLYKRGCHWFCSSEGFCGVGNTPEIAYRSWFHYMWAY